MNTKERGSLLLYVILGLLVINLALTASFWFTRADHRPDAQQPPSRLPEFANDASLQRLAERVQELYNAGDTVALYAEFDQLAKQQFSEQELETQLGQFIDVVGKVKSSAFSHHESSRYGDFDAYVLHYQVRLTDGPFSTGRMKLSVIDRGGSFGLMGFRVFGGSGG